MDDSSFESVKSWDRLVIGEWIMFALGLCPDDYLYDDLAIMTKAEMIEFWETIENSGEFVWRMSENYRKELEGNLL